jgi:8-amino-7-oxononanoate synthase
VTDVAGALQELRDAGLLRELRTIESAQGPRVRLDGRDVLLLCSNDYLGLAEHPRVRAAAAEAAERWGAGAGASRLVSGTMAPHRELEAELAAFKGTEACVLFGSGFLANTGVVAALAGRGEIVLSDALNHASIVDGCRLAAAETVVYDHADLDALAGALERAGGRRATIVTDSVFSMDGAVAPLEGIVELARRHGARVVVDEAHATGVVGPGGRGLVAALGLEGEVDVVIGTLSKALGSYGAFACCDAQMAAFLVNRARTLIFSTALPPPSVGAALEALRLVREEPALVERLWANARVLRAELAAQGFAVEPGDMPIVPLVIGDPRDAMALCEAALERGVFAQAIRPPTVPPGTSRLRLVAMASHAEHELRDAARLLGALRQSPASTQVAAE